MHAGCVNVTRIERGERRNFDQSPLNIYTRIGFTLWLSRRL